MGQNQVILRHLIIHFPTSEGVSEVSGASKRANGRASDPVLQSVFLAVFDHSERLGLMFAAVRSIGQRQQLP